MATLVADLIAHVCFVNRSEVIGRHSHLQQYSTAWSESLKTTLDLTPYRRIRGTSLDLYFIDPKPSGLVATPGRGSRTRALHVGVEGPGVYVGPTHVLGRADPGRRSAGKVVLYND